LSATSTLYDKCLFFGPKPLVAQKAYHAEYSMPSGCDSASAQENQHFAFGNKRKSEVTPPS